IIKDYKNKISFNQLYKKYNISPSVVKKILIGKGIEIPIKKFPSLIKSQTIKIKILYKRKLSLRKIAKKLNLTHGTISRYLKSIGYYVRKGSFYLKVKLNLKQEQEICKLYLKSNKTLSSLKLQFHTSLKTIKNILIKNKIKIKQLKDWSYERPPIKMKSRSYTGYYKNWFFRSLNELSFVLCELETNRIRWCSGETLQYRVQYKDKNNTLRYYYPDFILLDKKEVVECKPKRFWTDRTIKSKSKAAKKAFKKIDFIYKLIDYPINFKKIALAYKNKQIKFILRKDILFNKLKLKLNRINHEMDIIK
ncbi:MAG: helix-turn-helix domain-containing protein, partial [Nanoarchaeota archaeon]